VPVGHHHWFQLSVSVENESSNVLSQASPHLNVYLASCRFPWKGKTFSYGVNWHSTTSATLFLELSFHLYPDYLHLATLHFSHSLHLRWLPSFPADDAQQIRIRHMFTSAFWLNLTVICKQHTTCLRDPRAGVGHGGL